MLKKIKDFRAAHPLVSGLVIMAVVTLLILWGIMLFLNIWTHHGDDVTVPDVKHMSYLEARQKLHEADLEIAIADSVYDTSLLPGTIIEAVPKAGSLVKRGREIYVTMTAFSPRHVTISMPITGVSSRQAASYLNALGIHAIRYVQVPSRYADLVESAHADGVPIGVGSVIPVNASVVLSVGVAKTEEPETAGDSEDEEVSAEESVKDDLSTGFSTYDDEE